MPEKVEITCAVKDQGIGVFLLINTEDHAKAQA
jgi:hypothetical protein